MAAGALVLLTLAAVAGGLIVAGNPVELVRDKANEFKQLDTAAPGETRLGSTSGQRYDLWRIALNEFSSAPLIGVGEGSYPQRYYVERKTDRNLSTPHSLPMGVLAETGLVGLLFLLALPFAAVVAVARGWRALPPDGSPPRVGAARGRRGAARPVDGRLAVADPGDGGPRAHLPGARRRRRERPRSRRRAAAWAAAAARRGRPRPARWRRC